MNVSGQSTTRRPVPADSGPAAEPAGERLGRERRQIAFLRDAGQPFQAGQPRAQVRQPGRRRGQPGPERQVTHRVVRRRAQPPRVVVVQELGLVRRHVDADRAVALARLAGQAEIQRVAHLGRPPAVGDEVAADQLEQQPGSPARRVLLLAGDLVARAHRGAGRVAALPHTDAAAGGLREVAGVMRVREDGEQFAGRMVQLEVRVDPLWTDDHAGIHQVVRVPDGLEPPEQRHHVVAVHPRQQLRAGVAVAVLAGVRAAVPDHQVGGLLDEPRGTGAMPAVLSRSKSSRTWMQPSPK